MWLSGSEMLGNGYRNEHILLRQYTEVMEKSRQPAVYAARPACNPDAVRITPTIFWPREYGRESKTLRII